MRRKEIAYPYDAWRADLRVLTSALDAAVADLAEAEQLLKIARVRRAIGRERAIDLAIEKARALSTPDVRVSATLPRLNARPIQGAAEVEAAEERVRSARAEVAAHHRAWIAYSEKFFRETLDSLGRSR